jgi:hypothetical protein
MLSKHNPAGGASPHFDNDRLEDCIVRYQAQGDSASLGEIIGLTQRRVETLIRFNGTARYCAEAELISDINFKLLRAIPRFNPGKGSAFSFVSHVVTNVLRTSVSRTRTIASRFVELDEGIANNLLGETHSRDALDDLAHRIRAGAKTTLTDPVELSAQRWYIDSFTADGFESPRYECANAAMAVFNLSHDRSRELFDMVMLETRRVLYDDLPPRPPIAPGRLVGTRAAWMARYRPLVSESEFTKFVVLMRDLAPYLLLLVDTQGGSRRRDRNPPIGRRNLELILNGCPDARPLFSDRYFESSEFSNAAD